MNRIRQAVLGALAVAGSQAALAIPPGTTLDGIVGTNAEFYIGGSSALDNDIAKTLSGVLCDTTQGAMDTFQDIVGSGSTAVKGGFWKAYSCTLKPAGAYTVGSTMVTIPAALGSLPIIVHKRQKEGSLYGSVPVALNGYVEFLDLASTRHSGSCVADGANTYDCTVSALVSARDLPRHDPAFGGKPGELVNDDECDYNTVAAANPRPGVDKTLDTLCRRTTLGISDTEAEMFIGQNTNPRPNASDPANHDDMPATGLSAKQLGALTRSRVVGQVFGIIVSDQVYTALQTAQGIPNAAPVTDGTASNWPSLSSDQIRQLLSGTVSQWSQVVGNVSLAGTLNDVAVCRRDQGSGTQATINQYFFNYPCDTQNQSSARDTGGVGIAGGTGNITGSGVLYVNEGFSGTVLKNCVSAATAGTLPGITGANQTYGAIGILNVNGAAPATGWKWVKVDGVAPLLKNAIAGKYDLWAEAQVANNTANQSTNETAFVTLVKSLLGNPNIISSSTVADQGLGALTFNGFAWNNGTNNSDVLTSVSDFQVTNPVMGGNHGGGGAAFAGAGTSPLTCRKIQNQLDNATVKQRSM